MHASGGLKFLADTTESFPTGLRYLKEDKQE
jgi:hypothetical protein